MDIEARRQKLKEMREAREGKARQVAAGTSASVAPAGPTTTTTTAAATPQQQQATTTSAAPHQQSSSPQAQQQQQQTLSVSRGVGTISIEPSPPPPVQAYDKACLTDFVYVSTTAPPAADPGAVPTPGKQPAASTSGSPSPPRRPGAHSGGSMGGFSSWSALKAAAFTRLSDDGSSSSNNNNATANASSTLQSDVLHEFVSKSTFVAGRLSEASGGGAVRNLEGAFGIRENQEAASGKQKIARRYVYREPSVQNKMVTALAFQGRSAEFCAAAYGSDDPLNDSGAGVVHVWSIDHHSALPTVSFTSDSDVSSLMYHKYHSQLLIGGTFSGKVLTWDIRAGSKPVCSSFPSLDTHTTPVFGCAVVGSSPQSYSIITAGVDGHLCAWPERPVLPTQSGDLVNASSSGSTSSGTTTNSTTSSSTVAMKYVVNCNALAVSSRDPTQIIVGSADGALFRGSANVSSHREVDLQRVGGATAASHSSAITGIDCHPVLTEGNHNTGGTNAQATRSPDDDLVLTSSSDFTCRVWNLASGNSYVIDQFSDFVYDAKWSTSRAGTFAACDGSGTVSVFDSNKSMNAAQSTIRLDSGAANKLAFDPSGRHLVAGTSSGDVVVLTLAHSLSEAAAQDMESLSKFV